MSGRVGERGRLKYSKLFVVLLLALGLGVFTTGCSGGEDLAGKPGVAEFEKERQALADRGSDGSKGKKKRSKKRKKGKSAKAKKSGETGYAAGGADYFYDPRGKREPKNDKTCSQKIGFGKSGFCWCSHAGRTFRGLQVGCAHMPFRCVDKCGQAAKSAAASEPKPCAGFAATIVPASSRRRSADRAGAGGSGAAAGCTARSRPCRTRR